MSLHQRCRAAGVLLAAAAVRAQTPAPPPSIPVGGYVELMSNYIGRGLAQSVGQPSAQAELEFGGAEGLYFDLDATTINWIDQLYPGDSVSLEADLLLAYRKRVAQDWLWKAGFLRLQFPGRYVAQNPPVAEPHTTEAFVYVGWKGLSGRFNYALTEAFGTPGSRGSWYLDLNGSQPIGPWVLAAHLGRKESAGRNPDTDVSNRRFSYTDYKVSAEYFLRPDLSLALAESWTNANPAYYTLNGYNVGGHHLAAILKKTF